MGEYSNDSSHILLGRSENRKIGAIGFQYQRRVLHSRFVDLSYTAEARPAMIESDPTDQLTYYLNGPGQSQYIGPEAVTKCLPGTFNIDQDGGVVQGYVVSVCGRQKTFTEGLSPFGFRLNFLNGHRLPPVFSNYEGYMFAAHAVPIPQAGAFNFTFEFGAGLEWFLSHRKSVRLEYALQHFSNKDSANENPGVDSGFVKLTYSFGR
jgi:hypothetical protein